jgi:hypothetical protein
LRCLKSPRGRGAAPPGAVRCSARASLRTHFRPVPPRTCLAAPQRCRRSPRRSAQCVRACRVAAHWLLPVPRAAYSAGEPGGGSGTSCLSGVLRQANVALGPQRGASATFRQANLPLGAVWVRQRRLAAGERGGRSVTRCISNVFRQLHLPLDPVRVRQRRLGHGDAESIPQIGGDPRCASDAETCIGLTAMYVPRRCGSPVSLRVDALVPTASLRSLPSATVTMTVRVRGFGRSSGSALRGCTSNVFGQGNLPLDPVRVRQRRLGRPMQKASRGSAAMRDARAMARPALG